MVRERKWLSDEQKQMLRGPEREFILLLDEEDSLELVPYAPVPDVAHGEREVIAFTFERKGDLYAVYWHISGDKELELPMNTRDLTLLASMGEESQEIVAGDGNTTIVPVGKRRYLRTGTANRETLLTAFANAKILAQE
jgi:hypothetical protein